MVSVKRNSTKTAEKRKSETVRRQALNRRRDVERRRKMTQIDAALNRLSKKFRRVNIPRDTFNVGTVTGGNDRYLSVRLSRKTIKELPNFKETIFLRHPQIKKIKISPRPI